MKMPGQYKGFPEYYRETFKELYGHTFFEWKLNNAGDLEPGQICNTIVNYNVDKTYQLILDHHEPMSEYDSTWKLAPLSCRMPIRNERLQAFNLETNERFIIRRAKMRFVILITKIDDDFFIPGNESKILHSWLILPLFSYKDKHTQEFVLNDQQLLSRERFYIPPSTEVASRLEKESAARFGVIQQAVDNDIRPITALNDSVGMQKGIKISMDALRLIVYHFYKSLSILNELDGSADCIESQYDVFKSVIKDLVAANSCK
jgi:hypothetical protein